VADQLCFMTRIREEEEVLWKLYFTSVTSLLLTSSHFQKVSFYSGFSLMTF